MSHFAHHADANRALVALPMKSTRGAIQHIECLVDIEKGREAADGCLPAPLPKHLELKLTGRGVDVTVLPIQALVAAQCCKNDGNAWELVSRWKVPVSPRGARTGPAWIYVSGRSGVAGPPRIQ